MAWWKPKRNEPVNEGPVFKLASIPLIDMGENDVVVISAEKQLTKSERDDIYDYFCKAFPRRGLLILDDGLQIGVLKNLKRNMES